MKNSCLATLVAFLLMIFLSLFIMAAQIKTITNPQFLIKAIEKSQVFEQLTSSVDTIAASQRSTGQENLNATALTKVIIKSIDSTLIKTELNQAIVAFLNYVQGKSETLDATIDLKTWKQSFAQKWPTIAPPIFRAEYDNLPACDEGEKPNKMVGEEIVIDCKSPDLSADTIEESTKTADLNSLLTMVPDEYSLSDLAEKNKPLFDKIRLGFNVLNLVYWLSLTLSLLAIIGLVALGWPNWRAICSWNGWILFIVSAPIVILELFSPQMIGTAQSVLTTKFTQNVSQVLMAALESFNQAMIQATIGLTITILILSVILIILSFTLPKYEPKITPPGFRKE